MLEKCRIVSHFQCFNHLEIKRNQRTQSIEMLFEKVLVSNFCVFDYPQVLWIMIMYSQLNLLCYKFWFILFVSSIFRVRVHHLAKYHMVSFCFDLVLVTLDPSILIWYSLCYFLKLFSHSKIIDLFACCCKLRLTQIKIQIFFCFHW